MEQKKKGKLKKNLLFIGALILVLAIIIGYITVKDSKQKEILKKEVVAVTNKDLLKDNYDIEIKTTGDYAYIEKVIKRYFKKLSNNIKLINNYLTDEDLIYILSAKNLKNDGPKFEKSYQTLKNTKDTITTAMQEISDLCNEDTIKSLIDKKKINSKHYELYLELMYNKKDLEELKNTKDQIQTTSDNLVTFLNKVEQMINMLEKNKDYWYIENEQLYFETDNLVNQYNKLYNELNTFIKEKFPK